MHKITKGLKKKKKGKKSKHKEEELFKPEELEAYRKEHQVASSEQSAPATANDEWKKFNALTSGIDSFLKKTQDDLDRIKSTSFFQRVPPPSEQKKKQQELEERAQEVEQKKEEEAKQQEPGIIQVSETESEEEDEEDIFDTTYIDVIAAGEVKLAYIPESPTNEIEGDDPFDTSIAERAILGPAVEKKGKKLVPLGAAVEVLTGRVQAPTCVSIKRPSTRRTILKEKDLLLSSFDDNANSLTEVKCESQPDSKPSLLDDNAPPSLADEPIDLSKTLHQITPALPVELYSNTNTNQTTVQRFDVIKDLPLEDNEDEEFALLAAESLSKTVKSAIIPNTSVEDTKNAWAAFQEEPKTNSQEFVETDPFDTTFTENAVPGKYELKLIENEILSIENDIDFNPRTEDKLSDLIKNKVSSLATGSPCVSESEVKGIQPDLLGGSVTDLSKLETRPLTPADENYIEYCDPFDTTIVETATVPGQTELKFLEKELLSDIHNSDDDFDPRVDENYSRKASSASVKVVNFTLPLSSEVDSVLFPNLDHSIKKNLKPLTPYYVREDALLAQTAPDNDIEEEDPFDTSYVGSITPGKAELKVIESELFSENNSLKHSISDQDFNPRDEKQLIVAKVVQTIKEINEKPEVLPYVKPQIDLLDVDNELSEKVLTPSTTKPLDNEDLLYTDPFDTSIACNILPGKAELKLLETELIHTPSEVNSYLNDSTFNPRENSINTNSISIVQEQPKISIPDLLEHTIDNVAAKALTPIKINEAFECDDLDDTDPFDTSFANNIGPGQTELKLLESELI